MSKSRASIFGADDTDTLDVESFAPKSEVDHKAPPAEQVRAISQAANFKSREPNPAKVAPKPAKRPHRQYRTGRNVQLSVKALSETVERSMRSLTNSTGCWVTRYNVL
jgi:hypothetical protein